MSRERALPAGRPGTENASEAGSVDVSRSKPREEARRAGEEAAGAWNGQDSSRENPAKDRSLEAVPAPRALLQFIFVCKKVKVHPELGGTIAKEVKQRSSVQRDPLELPSESCSCY